MNKVAAAFGKKYNFADDVNDAIAEEIAALPDETLNRPMALPLPPAPDQPQDAGQVDAGGDQAANLEDAA